MRCHNKKVGRLVDDTHRTQAMLTEACMPRPAWRCLSMPELIETPYGHPTPSDFRAAVTFGARGLLGAAPALLAPQPRASLCILLVIVPSGYAAESTIISQCAVSAPAESSLRPLHTQNVRSASIVTLLNHHQN